MSEPLDEQYFTWLYSQVGDPRQPNPSRTYWKVLRQLYTKEFIWTVPNDDNRIEDGKELRYEFVDQSSLKDVDPGWVNLGCSMLELLVGLSRRLSFEAGGESLDWFWVLMTNLGLGGCTDARYNKALRTEEINEILDRVIWRTYEFDGRYGLFPLQHPCDDQRGVELWYQMCAYILERL